MAYKLSTVLQGHELDVRAVCPAVFPERGIITASRDRTCRVWRPSEDGAGFEEGHVFSGHKNFISSVCAVPASEKYPHGLVVTGGHDHMILVWTLDSLEPLHTLEGHTGTVCSLVAGKFGTLLSGSWDMTARVWLGTKCVMTLSGHEAAVWAVTLMQEHGLMLTGSADKTIKMWKAGTCQATFTGHTDCVRGLVVLSAVEFLSCSNDSTIRRWISTGECLQVYTGHTSFIYSIAVFPDGTGSFVSVGEDRTLRIWKGTECEQTITLPAQTVWCVTCLENGDIVTGSSDGVARVFTRNEVRVAPPDVIKHFEDEVSSQAIPAVAASGQLGDMKLEDIPGPEALLRPGNRSGQTILVRRGNMIECHQWNNMESKWDKVGEVVGAAGEEGTKRTAGKSVYNGKEYDFVFDVEIEEGKPPLKLPYNLTDDPWMAAHTFLEQNNLSQMFLDQVVKFIQGNTQGFTIGQQAPAASDPFTGGSRYVPGTGAAPVGAPPSGAGADPFTGASSYRPASLGTNEHSNTTPAQNPYFPKTSYIYFESANVSAILGKLTEFNRSCSEPQQLTEKELAHITDFLKAVAAPAISEAPSDDQRTSLQKALAWPDNMLFPALDVLRLAVRHAVFAQTSCSGPEGDALLALLLQSSQQGGPAANAMLCFRALANLFATEHGAALLLKYREKIFDQLPLWAKSSNKNVRVSLCTVILNFSILFRKNNDFEGKTRCLSALSSVLQDETDSEVRFRSLVACGTLISDDSDTKELAQSLGLETAVRHLSSIADPPKVGECASLLLAVLSE